MLLLSLVLFVGGVVLYVQSPALLIYWAYPWPVYLLMTAAVGCAVRSRRRGWRRYATIGVTGLLTVLFVGYTAAFSRLSHGELAVHPGDAFPDFTLRSSTNEPFSSSQLKGQSAALYVFYRGDW